MKIISRIRDLLYNIIDYAFVIFLSIGLGALIWFSYRHLLQIEDRPASAALYTTSEDSSAKATVDVRLPAALSSKQLAEILVGYGILQENQKSDFEKFIDEKGLSPIPNGEVSLYTGQSFDEIFEALKALQP